LQKKSKLGFKFADADDFHSSENKELMRNGIGLNDQQRLPWLIF
jgi:gluconokinase